MRVAAQSRRHLVDKPGLAHAGLSLQQHDTALFVVAAQRVEQLVAAVQRGLARNADAP